MALGTWFETERNGVIQSVDIGKATAGPTALTTRTAVPRSWANRLSRLAAVVTVAPSRSQALARAIWNVVLLSKDEHKARLIGKTARRKLVDRIVELMRIARARP